MIVRQARVDAVVTVYRCSTVTCRRRVAILHWHDSPRAPRGWTTIPVGVPVTRTDVRHYCATCSDALESPDARP